MILMLDFPFSFTVDHLYTISRVVLLHRKLYMILSLVLLLYGERKAIYINEEILNIS
jgi:hypothetical protein